MREKLGDLIKKAYKEAGVDLPRSKAPEPKERNFSSQKQNQTGQSKHRGRSHRQKKQRHNTKTQTKEAPRFRYSSAYASVKPSPLKEIAAPPTPAYTLSLGETSRVLLDDFDRHRSSRMISVRSDGRLTTLQKTPQGIPDYELTLGLDFGTSSTKI